MATNSYFRERARNPYLRARRPAPGLEEEDPNASPPAPTFPRAMPLQPEVVARPDMPASFLGPLLAGGGLPGGERAAIPGMPQPAPEPTPLPPDPLDAPRAAFMAGTPTTTKGRILQALANAGLGALQAAERDRENPLGAALGGAIAGGGISAVNPRYGRAYQFETFKRPEIEAREAREQELLRRRRAEEDRALKLRETEADIGYKGALTTKALAPERAVAPRLIRTDRGLWNEATGRIIPGTEPLPKTEDRISSTDPRLSIDPESGMSVEEMARASYEARGGDDYVRSKLPARTKQILEAGTVAVGGKTRPANHAERDAAQREFERAIERQLNADKDYTRGATRRKNLGGGKARQGGTGISRPRSQFNSKLFPGLKFD